MKRLYMSARYLPALGLALALVAEAGKGDELSGRIYASYQNFRGLIVDWSDIAERAFLNARALT